MTKYILILLFLVLPGISGCFSSDDEGQDFDNLFEGTDFLVLSEEEHPSGWGRPDCFVCHPISEIHRVDRSGLGLPLEDIRNFVNDVGIDSCAICHGDNGVFEQ